MEKYSRRPAPSLGDGLTFGRLRRRGGEPPLPAILHSAATAPEGLQMHSNRFATTKICPLPNRLVCPRLHICSPHHLCPKSKAVLAGLHSRASFVSTQTTHTSSGGAAGAPLNFAVRCPLIFPFPSENTPALSSVSVSPRPSWHIFRRSTFAELCTPANHEDSEAHKSHHSATCLATSAQRKAVSVWPTAGRLRNHNKRQICGCCPHTRAIMHKRGTFVPTTPSRFVTCHSASHLFLHIRFSCVSASFIQRRALPPRRPSWATATHRIADCCD